jgi:hypothetical protein
MITGPLPASEDARDVTVGGGCGAQTRSLAPAAACPCPRRDDHPADAWAGLFEAAGARATSSRAAPARQERRAKPRGGPVRWVGSLLHLSINCHCLGWTMSGSSAASKLSASSLPFVPLEDQLGAWRES